jgi:hypothetical protein
MRRPTEAAYRPRSTKRSAHWSAMWCYCRASSRNHCLASRSCTWSARNSHSRALARYSSTLVITSPSST